MWNEHMGAPHHYTGPGGAILPVEGVDTHLTVGWTRLRGPILRRVAGVAVHRATVHTDRCTGRGCTWNEHMGAPHHSTGPGGAILPVFYRLNSCATHLRQIDRQRHRERDRPESPVSFRKSRRQRPIFRLTCSHNARIDLPSHPHKCSPYFTDSTLVRPTLDKSTDSDTERALHTHDHPGFRKLRRHRPMFCLIYAHVTLLLAGIPREASHPVCARYLNLPYLKITTHPQIDLKPPK